MPCEQTCNPLAPSRGKHKECGCQAAVLNLPMSERFKPSNILLVAVSRVCVYKQYGMAHVLCGVDKGGNQDMDMPCYARDMRALDEGVYTNIPDDVNGGSRRVRLRGWQTAIGADMLGAHSLGPFMESPSAHVFCRGCNVHQGKPHAYAPTSFLRKEREGSHPAPTERNMKDLTALLDRLRAPTMGATERGVIMSENGLNSLYYAMDPAYIPHVDITKDAVQEGLHLFGDGLLRSEGAWMFYLFIKLGLKLDVVNRAIQAYPNWPRDCRIPPLHAGLRDGVTGGKPKAEKTLRMSGAECMHFAQHRCAPRTHPAPLIISTGAPRARTPRAPPPAPPQSHLCRLVVAVWRC